MSQPGKRAIGCILTVFLLLQTGLPATLHRLSHEHLAAAGYHDKAEHGDVVLRTACAPGCDDPTHDHHRGSGSSANCATCKIAQAPAGLQRTYDVPSGTQHRGYAERDTIARARFTMRCDAAPRAPPLSPNKV